MDASGFVLELEALKDDRLRAMVSGGVRPAGDGVASTASAGALPAAAPAPARDGQVRLLQVALANEIAVSELAAAWMPLTPELDIKIALARQAGDEARHFQLVADRLAGLGFDPAGFALPATNPLFDYLRGLPGSVERVAAGLFTLESIAYGVNESFMHLCDDRGDRETARLYREFIQPDELAHQRLGADLLRTHAATADLQARARAAVLKTIEIASALRAAAAARLGTSCFPGC